MKKILITGGHLTPALAVAAELEKRKWEIIYIGRKYALEGDKTISQEFKIISARGYKFLSLFTGRMQRTFTRHTLGSIIKIPMGFIQAGYYLLKYKPQIILSFGGYVALPVVIAGWLLHIPAITHEQTLSPGLANKVISFFAKKILVGWEENLGQFPKNKTILTGMPVRAEIFKIIKKFDLPSDKPVIYITGGNLGSHSINSIIERNLEELLNKYTLIHQCGDTVKYQDYEKMQNLKKQLPPKISKYYFIFKFIQDDYIGWVMNKTDLLITRSGANIISEIISLQKPAILIPLPWSGNNEQVKNAKYLSDCKAAITINQDHLSKNTLLNSIETIIQEKNQITLNLNKLNNKMIQNAAIYITEIIESEKT